MGWIRTGTTVGNFVLPDVPEGKKSLQPYNVSGSIVNRIEIWRAGFEIIWLRLVN